MKGRVACEMGQNELIITELVLRNILTNLQPAEIAALLSSLVFQAQTDVEPKVTETLKQMMQAFVEVDEDIRQVERRYNVSNNDESVAKTGTSELLNSNVNQLWATAGYLMTNRKVNYPDF